MNKERALPINVSSLNRNFGEVDSAIISIELASKLESTITRESGAFSGEVVVWFGPRLDFDSMYLVFLINASCETT